VGAVVRRGQDGEAHGVNARHGRRLAATPATGP
jgi:hypothetical protein